MALPVNSICVIGLGYIGLPTAIIFASHGVKVTGVDVSDRHVDAVNRGELPFVEEGLDVVLKEVVDKGDDLTACSALAAVHLSVAAIRCMQAELLSYAKEMDDDVFGYTIVREAELNLANHQELIDGLVEELTRRLTREKK